MMKTYFKLILICLLIASLPCSAKSKRKRYSTPITHPILLWARTLSGSTDAEEKKRAAFKLSQYTQTIYQDEAVRSLLDCLKETDITLRVLCTKALGKAGSAAKNEQIRKMLLQTYTNDPVLKVAILNTLIKRKDISKETHDFLLSALNGATETEEMQGLLSYFEQFGLSADMDTILKVYKKNETPRVRRAAIKTMTEKSQGQDEVVEILAQCALDKDTPLALNCLSGLQAQAKNSPKAIEAVEKTIQSSDPDVLLATLDVLNALTVQKNPVISKRLVEIINTTEDSDVNEKAVLSLGVVGDNSEEVITSLVATLKNKSISEGIQIAAALVLGKQAPETSVESQDLLNKCKAESASQALRKACQLGLQELESRIKQKSVSS